MDTYNIALYPGDGIGLEVTAEVVKCFKAAEDKFGDLSIKLTEYNWGSRYWEETGQVVPTDYLETLINYDAVFLGAIGDPERVPDHITIVPLIEMRQKFDQYVCLRPAKLLPGIESPLANKGFGDIDIMVIRENSEGEYASVGGRFKEGSSDEVSVQTAIHTRKGVERIIRYGFDLAAKRKKHMTMTTKSNAQKYSMVFWDDVLADVVSDYPGITSDKFHVDALAMNFVKMPEFYDVVVASNLFGDILSDLAGAISGSLGLAPSANINPERKFPSLFEPVHGSAPDIAGKGIANPIAAIRSAALMMDFVGRSDVADLFETSVIDSLKDGTIRTPDIGGSSSTSEVGDEICRRILGA